MYERDVNEIKKLLSKSRRGDIDATPFIVPISQGNNDDEVLVGCDFSDIVNAFRSGKNIYCDTGDGCLKLNKIDVDNRYAIFIDFESSNSYYFNFNDSTYTGPGIEYHVITVWEDDRTTSGRFDYYPVPCGTWITNDET